MEGSRHVDGVRPSVRRVNPGPNRSGVIVLRAWMHDGQVVARIQSSRSDEEEQQAAVALGAPEIERTVHEWLRDLAETQP